MRRYRNRIIAGVLGAALLAAWIGTGRKEISKEDKKVYEEALKLQDEVDGLGFRGFCLADYPVAVYDGTSDYVFWGGEVRRRKPVLETFVGTAYPVGDHFEVIVPALEQFDSLMSMAGGVESMVTGSGYGADEQISTIWHEAFHAYQLTEYTILGEKVTPKEMLEDMENASEISEEERIVEEVDGNPEIKKKLEMEMKLLKRAVDMILSDTGEGNEAVSTQDIDGLRDIVLEYRECRRQRLSEMTEKAQKAEIRCELTEGTAYYAEYSVYRMRAGENAVRERYLENLDRFEGGRGKYYRTGLAKCLILDELSPGWKETFDFTKGLDEVMEASSIK